MASTAMKAGQTISGTTTHKRFRWTGASDAPTFTLTLELLTGSYQYAVVPIGSAPVIDSSYTTISTANDKKLVALNPGIEELEILGTSTIHVS